MDDFKWYAEVAIGSVVGVGASVWWLLTKLFHHDTKLALLEEKDDELEKQIDRHSDEMDFVQSQLRAVEEIKGRMTAINKNLSNIDGHLNRIYDANMKK